MVELSMKDKQRIAKVIMKKNHKVLVIIDPVPELDGVIADYLLENHPMIIGVLVTKTGGVVTLTNGATITFMVNEPNDMSRYQLVIDKTQEKEKEVKKDELERNDKE